MLFDIGPLLEKSFVKIVENIQFLGAASPLRKEKIEGSIP